MRWELGNLDELDGGRVDCRNLADEAGQARVWIYLSHSNDHTCGQCSIRELCIPGRTYAT